jgi:hypothetical protein
MARWRLASFRPLAATARSSMKFVIRSIPISDAGRQCETKQRLSQTRRSLLFWCKDRSACIIYSTKIMITILKDSSWKEIAGELHAQDKELSRKTQHCRRMAGYWQGRGRGTAWERHGMCESAFNTEWERHGMCESAFRISASRGLLARNTHR